MNRPFWTLTLLRQRAAIAWSIVFCLGTAAVALHYCTMIVLGVRERTGAYDWKKITPSSTFVSNHAKPLVSLRQRGTGSCVLAPRSRSHVHSVLTESHYLATKISCHTATRSPFGTTSHSIANPTMLQRLRTPCSLPEDEQHPGAKRA